MTEEVLASSTEYLLRGGLFENLVINKIIIKYYNSGQDADVFFYRDKHGNKVDGLLTMARNIVPIEIKSSETFHSAFLKSLQHFQHIYPYRIRRSILEYGGTEEQRAVKINIINIKNTNRKIEMQ